MVTSGAAGLPASITPPTPTPAPPRKRNRRTSPLAAAAAAGSASPEGPPGAKRRRAVCTSPASLPGPVALDAAGHIAGTMAGIDSSFRAYPGFIPRDHAGFPQLLQDCKAAYQCTSFWLPADMTPRCTLERLARTIFAFHTRDAVFDPSISGAEWWVQFRGPQRDTGEAIGFHWDKDERWRDEFDQYVHPQVATVTYMKDDGAPTLILGARPLPRDVRRRAVHKGFLAHPVAGKHVAFDGRYLHGVPPELMARPPPRSYERVTFLVNVWLHHRPHGAHPFPADKLPALSDQACDFTLEGKLVDATPVATKATSRVRGFAFGKETEPFILMYPVPAKTAAVADNLRISFSEGGKAYVVRDKARSNP